MWPKCELCIVLCLVLGQGCEIHCDIESRIAELPEQQDSIILGLATLLSQMANKIKNWLAIWQALKKN